MKRKSKRHRGNAHFKTILDQIGLPEFRAGAMENWGLVIYKYQYIAFNPNVRILPYSFTSFAVEL